MTDYQCMYCEKGEKLKSLMTYICDVDGFPLYLNHNQTLPGRVILCCDKHIPKIADLTCEQATAYFAAVHKTVRALTAVYMPDQINIGMYGDTVTHVHCHIVPKYKDKTDWNNVFQMNPQPPVKLNEDELAKNVELIRAAVEKIK